MKAKDVKYVFDQNPALADIGSKVQYYKYLKTIFPESKVKDFFWHSSFDKIKDFKVIRGEDAGVYFSPKIYDSSRPNQYAVLLNVESPEYLESTRQFFDEDAQKFKEEGIDTVISTKTLIVNGKEMPEEIISFDSSKIYSLGSKKDIQGFRDFVKNQKGDSLERKVISSVFIFLMAIGILFSAPSITGNIVGTNNIFSYGVGILIFIIGIFGFFFYRRFLNQ